MREHDIVVAESEGQWTRNCWRNPGRFVIA